MIKTILAAAVFFAGAQLWAGETACVHQLRGTVEILKSGEKDWLAAPKGLPVAEGDRLRTGEDAWCELLFKDGSFVRLEAGSETAAEELRASDEGRSFGFSFLKGKALWMAAKLKGRVLAKFAVRTPSAVCAVRGTDFTVIVSSAGTDVGLFDGKMSVSGAGEEKELLAGGEASVGSGGVAVQRRLSDLMKQEERRYSKVRGRVERLRRRLQERETYLDEYIEGQGKKIAEFESRRAEKLKKRK